MEEQRRLLVNQNSSNVNSSEEDEWSEESSSESYYSDSDSSVPEWEPFVDDVTGELLFIDCHPFVTQNNTDSNKVKENIEAFSRTQLRRSTRGNFLRLLRRRESKRHRKGHQKTQDNFDSATSSTKVKFHDSQEGEEKEVILKIFNENYSKSSHNATLSEILLGINVGTLSDGNRVMISGFLPDSLAKHEKNIKIGDWLKSINNLSVTYQNLNNILESVKDKTEVHLKLQRVAGVEVTKDPPMNVLNHQSPLVCELISSNQDNEQALLEILCQYPVGILYLNTEKLSETSPEFEDIIYCYPRPFRNSILCSSRGIFITLNHLIHDITKTPTRATSFIYKNQLCHVTCNRFNTKLLLFLFPDYCGSVRECVLINDEIIRMSEFLYETLDRCFVTESYKPQLDHFFGRFFTRLLSNEEWTTINSFINSHNLQNRPDCINIASFENVLPAAVTLHLPDEAFMQVDDALTELEASDYREWNEEPLDCQRLFTVLGSAYYHYGYLLATHLPYEDLIDIHIYCRQYGLFHLSESEPVKNLVLWKEVFPYSCSRSRNQGAGNIKIPDGKRYLLIVGSKKDLLAVIMEAGGCTEPAEENMGPDAFYVEEVQATLAHIQELGIPELADRLISTNPGPQITIPETCSKRKSDFIDTLNRTSTQQNKELKKPEVTSILKRRNSDQNLPIHSSTSFYSLADEQCDRHSEDSGSQGRSEMSEELPGRKPNERRNKYNSNDEDSDTDEYTQDGSQMSSSSFDISELRQTLLSETDIQPQQLTSGIENVLFHYVQFDSIEGILVCPPKCRLQSQTRDMILNNFRKCCHKIHSLFQNTMRFKNMAAQDMAKSVMNKSLIAIKEHGVMFECPFLEEVGNKKNKIKYWVIGRLFYVPHPKEVFICYQDNIPQNVIEVAFKIDLNTMT